MLRPFISAAHFRQKDHVYILTQSSTLFATIKILICPLGVPIVPNLRTSQAFSTPCLVAQNVTNKIKLQMTTWKNEDKNLTKYYHIAKFQAMIFEQMKIFLSDVAEAEKWSWLRKGIWKRI